MDPVGALVGAILTAFGIVVLYGAVKNRKVFGANGLIPTALTTGTIADLSKIPEAFPDGTRVAKQSTVEAIRDLFETQATWVVPRTVQDAVVNIGADDPVLATQIATELNKTDSDSTRQDLMPLAQLLALADAKGHKTDADAVRHYIRERNNVAI